jgi:cell division protease FtsH
MARNMVMKYGMSDVLGPVQFGDEGGEVFIGKEIAHSRNYGEQIASTIDAEVKRIMDTSYSEAIRIIKENIDVLHATAKLLIEKEKITGEEFRAILKDPKSFQGVSLEKETAANAEKEVADVEISKVTLTKEEI